MTDNETEYTVESVGMNTNVSKVRFSKDPHSYHIPFYISIVVCLAVGTWIILYSGQSFHVIVAMLKLICGGIIGAGIGGDLLWQHYKYGVSLR